MLTPSGVSAKLQLTRDFLTYKEQEFEQLQIDISVLRLDLLQKPQPANSNPTEAGAAASALLEGDVIEGRHV